MSDLPTVSVLLYGYNSAKYVARTVRSLLAQEYPHVEFYFSDDGSTDGSYEIMQSECAATKRPVTLHINPSNFGICNQINAGVSRTSGSLVMLANADDIYPAHYLSRLIGAWQSRSPRPTVAWAQLESIDEHDQPVGRVLLQRTSGDTLSTRIRGRACGPGATGALYDRRVFTEFGPLPDNLMLEDSCLGARAFILGEPLYLEEPLVRYRVHRDNISQVYFTEEFTEWLKRHRTRVRWHALQGHRAFVEMLRDLHQRPSLSVEPSEVMRARWAAIEKIVETALRSDYYNADYATAGLMQLKMLGRLSLLCAKLAIRRWIPYFDLRGARREYRNYTNTSGAPN